MHLAKGSFALACLAAFASQGIQGCNEPAGGPTSDAPTPSSSISAPIHLYLPEREIPPRLVRPSAEPTLEAPGSSACPPEMVNVSDRFCIDRYEAVLVTMGDGRRVSPYYHPTRLGTRTAHQRFQEQRDLTPIIDLELPEPPAWQLEEVFETMAVVRPGEVPNGYLSGEIAEQACQNAGKRLCTEDEWVTACRGAAGTQFPYGSVYEAGACNVMSEVHPAEVLYGNASIGHLDPRLNLIEDQGRPLLLRVGSLERCASYWGGQAIYDMVGNLDEWVADEQGTFLGGFYARQTRDGCEAAIRTHPKNYYDYSLGTRCCL